MGWQWADEKDLSKLLGTPFGIDVDTEDIDSFLIKRVKAKLDYWVTTKLSLVAEPLS